MTENGKRITKNWPKNKVSGLPPFASIFKQVRVLKASPPTLQELHLQFQLWFSLLQAMHFFDVCPPWLESVTYLQKFWADVLDITFCMCFQEEVLPLPESLWPQTPREITKMLSGNSLSYNFDIAGRFMAKFLYSFYNFSQDRQKREGGLLQKGSLPKVPSLKNLAYLESQHFEKKQGKALISQELLEGLDQREKGTDQKEQMEPKPTGTNGVKRLSSLMFADSHISHRM